MSDEEHSNSAFYYPEEQWRSQGGARGGDRPPNGPQDRSREKSKSGEKF